MSAASRFRRQCVVANCTNARAQRFLVQFFCGKSSLFLWEVVGKSTIFRVKYKPRKFHTVRQFPTCHLPVVIGNCINQFFSEIKRHLGRKLMVFDKSMVSIVETLVYKVSICVGRCGSGTKFSNNLPELCQKLRFYPLVKN